MTIKLKQYYIREGRQQIQYIFPIENITGIPVETSGIPLESSGIPLDNTGMTYSSGIPVELPLKFQWKDAFHWNFE